MNKTVKEKLVLKTKVKILISKIMLTIIFFLIGMIITKKDPTMKDSLNKIIYEQSFKFTSLKGNYEKYFGKFLSLNRKEDTVNTVFSEKIIYEKLEKYENGIKLKVNNNYLVPTLESGVVIFIGNKDPYGKTVIIEQVDGTDMMYGNIEIKNLKLYDYIEKGNIVGEAINSEIYLVAQKNGKYLDYKEYI